LEKITEEIRTQQIRFHYLFDYKLRHKT